MRSTEKVTQLQGVPIDVGSVREGEGQETRCESTGGCERKQGKPAGDIRGERRSGGAARARLRDAAGKEPPSTAVSAYVLLYHYGRPATRLS